MAEQNQGWETDQPYYNQYWPPAFIEIFIGFTLLFYGGIFAMSIACYMAVQLSVWDTIKRSWTILKRNYSEGMDAFEKDPNAKKFFDITNSTYTPTDQEIARLPTTGLRSASFNVEKNKFTIVDVGGKRRIIIAILICLLVHNVSAVDTDNDGVEDALDNAPTDPYECQDVDADGCDDCAVTGPLGGPPNPGDDGPDSDGDGICDTGMMDPCWGYPNVDTDNDGWCDSDDNCPDISNPDQADADGDGKGDACETIAPTLDPTLGPTTYPTNVPTVYPTSNPSNNPSFHPSKYPTIMPTNSPTRPPSVHPSTTPTASPSNNPTNIPSRNPTVNPSESSSRNPTVIPSLTPSKIPTETPTANPSISPSNNPTTPTTKPSNIPTTTPLNLPTKTRSNNPTINPSNHPTMSPSNNPTKTPSNVPTATPSNSPSTLPTINPSNIPTIDPTKAPTTQPPTQSPLGDGETATPTGSPTPTRFPTAQPITKRPTAYGETLPPTLLPTASPSRAPVTSDPTESPVTTASPVTANPTAASLTPTASPVETCAVDNSLGRVDCDDGNVPDGQCSVLFKVSFDVCYVEPYMNGRGTLWTNVKTCACSDVFAGSELDDGVAKRCYVVKYFYANQDPSGSYSEYPDAFEFEDDCPLQSVFKISVQLYHSDCDYVMEIAEWLLDEGDSVQDGLGECILKSSKAQNQLYGDHGFGRVHNTSVVITLRDENGDSDEIETGSAVLYSISPVIWVVLSVIVWL
eukprot:477050_1